MKTIIARNVNEVYPLGIKMLVAEGVRQDSQHGATLEIPEPVSVMYACPDERVLFNVDRDINPFLHFFEPLWILAGRKDVEFLEYIVPNMAKYSDNGEDYYGAYGYRMRGMFPFEINGDQIEQAIARLRKDPDSRQIVINIREAHDLWYYGKDTPCNLMVTTKIRQGKLNIHVFNRSNDFIWGLTGTNVCQFSMLQEYMADRLGVGIGVYHQTTDSFHAYINDQWDKVTRKVTYDDPYQQHKVQPYPMGANHPSWDDDLREFFFRFDTSTESKHYQTPFFCEVVEPMWRTFNSHLRWRADKTEKNATETRLDCNDIVAEDWHAVTMQWLTKRWGA